MAMTVAINEYGVDVAKDWLDIFDGVEVIRIDNNLIAIQTFLRTLSASCAIAIESTNTYHELLVEMAIATKHTVYVIDAFRLSHYRDGVGVRAKTDSHDARLLRRYLRSEKSSLVAYKPLPKAVKRINRLLKVRAKLAKSKSTISMSLSGVAEVALLRRSLLKNLNDAMKAIDKRLLMCVQKSQYYNDYLRCLAIPGVGPLNAIALVAQYHRGYFTKSDSFIAFMGLDVRVRESGYFKGRRKLTKRGNPEMRRLLFNAARSGSRTKQWNTYYLSLRERGHSTTAAAVALSRKIARLAFALMKNRSEFCAV